MKDRVTQDIGGAFGPVEMSLWYMFVTALFQSVGEGTLGRGVTLVSVKQAVIELPDPTKTAPKNWTASCVITGHIVAALRGQKEFRTSDHAVYMREGN